MAQNKTISNRGQPKSTIRSLLQDRRLIMLTGMLVLVFYAMIEAGKPKTWIWLFPEQRTPSLNSSQTNREKVPTEGQTDRHDAGSQNDSRGDDDEKRIELQDESFNQNPTPFATTDGRFQSSSSSQQHPNRPSSDLPDVIVRFWSDQFRRLDREQQSSLFLMLYYLRNPQLNWTSSTTVQQRQSWIDIVNRLQDQKEKLHYSLLSEANFTQETSERKKSLVNDLFESEQFWQLKLEPAFNAVLASAADEVPDQTFDLTDSAVEGLQQIQWLLDGLVFAQVQDRSGLGLGSDSLAWKRIWEQTIRAAVSSPAPIPVTHLELSGQPEFYRGRAVQIDGIVQAARIDPFTVQELQIERMYTLLVKPGDSSISPIFVYCKQLPNDFPELTENYSTLYFPIQIKGYFFKIRAYTDTAREIQNAPVVLASSVTIVSNLSEVDEAVPETETFVQIFATALLGVSILAVIGAWVLFRYSDRNLYRPAADYPDEIREKLADLKNNANIKTELERVQELNDP